MSARKLQNSDGRVWLKTPPKRLPNKLFYHNVKTADSIWLKTKNITDRQKQNEETCEAGIKETMSLKNANKQCTSSNEAISRNCLTQGQRTFTNNLSSGVNTERGSDKSSSAEKPGDVRQNPTSSQERIAGEAPIYGYASQRLQKLKKQLQEARFLRENQRCPSNHSGLAKGLMKPGRSPARNAGNNQHPVSLLPARWENPSQNSSPWTSRNYSLPGPKYSHQTDNQMGKQQLGRSSDVRDMQERGSVVCESLGRTDVQQSVDYRTSEARERANVFRARDSRRPLPSPYRQLCDYFPGRPHERELDERVQPSRAPVKVFPRRLEGGRGKASQQMKKQIRLATPILKTSCSPPKVKEDAAGVKGKKEPDSKPAVVEKQEVSEDESMDWEPIEPEQVVLHVGEFRKQNDFQQLDNPDLAHLCKKTVLASKWFVVLDTNVLLSNLLFVEELLETADPKLGLPTLLIPWVVIVELDHLKSPKRKSQLVNAAKRAIKFVWDKLIARHPRVEGQPRTEAEGNKEQEADDSILQFSLEVKKKCEKVILLTNDRNLQNKALIHQVECASAKRLQEKLSAPDILPDMSPSKQKISATNDCDIYFTQLKSCVKMIMEQVLVEEMKEAYGTSWTSILHRKLPLSLDDVFFCYLKHWIAVLGVVLPSSSREDVEELQSAFANKQSGNSWPSIKTIAALAVPLVKKLPTKYKETINKTLVSLNEVLSISNQRIDPAATPQSTDFVTTSSTQGTFSVKDDESGLGSFTECSGDVDGVGKQGGSCNVNFNDSYEDVLSIAASSFSEDASDISSSDAGVDKGQRVVQYYLDQIFEKIAVYCGMLCEVMGEVPCVPYQHPEQFPGLEVLRQNLSVFFPCVHTLLLSIRGLLAVPVQDLSEDHPTIKQLYNTIKDSMPSTTNQNEVEPLVPKYILSYCTQDSTRQQLERGAQQFDQFQTIFNRAIIFFMGQSCPLPTF